MNLNDLANEIYINALEKGWHDKPRSALEQHALFHSEISEATEEVRNGKPYLYYTDGKPDGEAVELVDAVIRIIDYFKVNGWNLEEILKIKMEYNKTRSYRHGGKRY